ncbi:MULTISPECIES: GNAT family N-acetyltransferase [unclassified Microbulbifer]|uniref:GNAT family N-acetyltransferase n=1 Tax=unclassified Microbulbifer TaxID=2619833 RepID=UPI0027E3C282|nr:MULTISPECIES: GNAT family N-acetyltransferase [unclassified Microbulbifer]
MSELVIRAATADDVPLILRFIRELAIYEKAEQEVVATERLIEGSLFSASSTAHALICENGGQPVGFAVYFFNYSTWLGRNGLYLEDLYVTPEARGCGAGKALLKHLARIAVDRGCGRFEWSVLDWNEPAIKFYESLGARPQSEWVGYRLTGRALLDLAESE